MRIFIDMDEVVADAQQQFIDWYERDYGIKHTPQQFAGKYLHNIVPPEHASIVANYINQKGFFRSLKVIPHSVDVIKLMLEKKHEVFLLSAAMEFKNSLIEKYEWIDEHFPFIHWQYRIFCGTKKMALGDVLIDDHIFNLKVFQGRNILFTSPHNVNETHYERANNWLEIKEKLSL